MAAERLIGRGLRASALAFLLATASAYAQPQTTEEPPAPDVRAPAVPGVDTDARDASAMLDGQLRKRRFEMERELKKLRHKYFGSIRKTEIRQEGIALLREFTDPIIYPALIKIFERDQADVRTAILDMLFDQDTEEGNITLAWVAAFDKDQLIRAEALHRLRHRVGTGDAVPARIRAMIIQALKSGSDAKITGAAELAESLKMFDAIPWLITAQFGGPGSSSGGVSEPTGDLAYIVIGNQTAFVSDLTPIVSDSAVAFDPTLSTLTTGTILRVQDAVVTTHRTIIQPVLVRMTSEAWGQPTDGLGYDGGKWWNWYRTEYLPYVGAKLAENQQTPDASAPAVEAPATPPGGGERSPVR
ncbi:MAG: hypothetical protein AMXMBFR58_26040 [Phycisphaerae bacterium]|nr:hypothetical protein [Phycisphaerales bacterium]MCK6475855.1 hypothetical protein [Phycisphaerales bacterium]